jgi:uncharacterized membrane protein YhaH (DUF805 family)
MWFYPSLEHFLVQFLVAVIFVGITISNATVVVRRYRDSAVVTPAPFPSLLQLGAFALQYISALWLLFHYYPASTSLFLVVLALIAPLIDRWRYLEEVEPQHSVSFANFTIAGWLLLVISS